MTLGTVLAMPTENPEVPPGLIEKWEELLRLAAEREQAQENLTVISVRARELVVELLQGGVQRKHLVDRPFSDAGLAKIQKVYGIRTRR